MKKIAFVLMLTASIFGVSAFNAEKPAPSSLTIYYESSPGVFTEIPASVEPCMQGTTTQCVVEINGQNEPLWLDQGITPFKRD